MASDDLIARYLDALSDRLGSRVGGRNRVLAETEEHLRTTVSGLIETAMTPVVAQQTAIARFGTPESVAADFVALDHTRFRARRTTAALGVVWGVAALLLALTSLSGVNSDARPIVATASVVFPLASIAAAIVATRDRLRLAGALLVVSSAAPTYYFWIANLPALVLGAFLMSGVVPPRSRPLPVAAKAATGVGAAILAAVVMIGLAVVIHTVGGSASVNALPTKKSFCSVMTETNGSELIALARSGRLGDSTNWIVDGTTNMALPAVRNDMTIIRHAIEAKPPSLSAETHAAAARVDAFVLETCGPQKHP